MSETDLTDHEKKRLAKAARERVLAGYDALLEEPNVTSPWEISEDHALYGPDLELLSRIITLPVQEHATTQTGLLGLGLDAWFAQEFRRAGFNADWIWPRPCNPRVIPTEITNLLESLNKKRDAHLRTALEQHLRSASSVAPRDANILGRAYVKQVDVAMSSWQTGPELLLSTKSMSSSFGKNLANRFEEAYGDAGNLRARHPLAAVGFAFVTSAEILNEPAQVRKAVDMMYKLRDRGDGTGYTTTTLICFDTSAAGEAMILLDAFPEDLGPGPFMAKMIETILEAAPDSRHEEARRLRYPGSALTLDA